MLNPDFVCDARRLEGLDQSTLAYQCTALQHVAPIWDVWFWLWLWLRLARSVPFSDQTCTLLEGKRADAAGAPLVCNDDREDGC
jgi:hypothetical protein